MLLHQLRLATDGSKDVFASDLSRFHPGLPSVIIGPRIFTVHLPTKTVMMEVAATCMDGVFVKHTPIQQRPDANFGQPLMHADSSKSVSSLHVQE